MVGWRMSTDRKKFAKGFTGDLGDMMTREEFQNKVDQLFRSIMSYIQEIKGSGEKQLYGSYAGEDIPPGLIRQIAKLEIQREAMRTPEGKKTIERKIDQVLRRYGWTYAKFPLVQLPWSELRRERDEMERIPQFGVEDLEGALEDD
jgi:hypothetical protein